MTVCPNDLTTVASVLAYLPTDTPAGDAALLQTLVTACSTMIQSYIGYNVASQSWTDVYNGNGRESLMLRNRPVSAVSAVVIDGVTLAESSGWPTAGWSFDETSIFLRDYSFRKGRGNVAVSYTSGYASVPADLAQAATELVMFRYASRLKAGYGLVSESAMNQTTSYSQRDMPASVLTALEPYRRVFIA